VAIQCRRPRPGKPRPGRRHSRSRWSRERLAKTRGGSGESDTNNEGNDHSGRRMTLGKRARERIGENRSPGRSEGGAPGPGTKRVSVFGRGVQCNVE